MAGRPRLTPACGDPDGVEVLSVVALSLRAPVHSAGLTHSDKTTVFVRVETDAASGWGECSAYPGARPPDPTVVAVEHVVMDQGVRRLFAACPNGGVPDRDGRSCAHCGRDRIGRRSRSGCRRRSRWRCSTPRSSAPPPAARSPVRSGRPGQRRWRPGRWWACPARDETSARLVESDGGGPRGRGVPDGGSPRQDRARLQFTHAAGRRSGRDFGEAVLSADANGSYRPRPSLFATWRSLDALRSRAASSSPSVRPGTSSLPTGCSRPSADVDADRAWTSRCPRSGGSDKALAARACRVATCIKPGRMGGVFSRPWGRGLEGVCGGGRGLLRGRALRVRASAGRSTPPLAGRPEFGLPGDLGDPGALPRRRTPSPTWPHTGVRRARCTLSANPGLGSTVHLPRRGAASKHTLSSAAGSPGRALSIAADTGRDGEARAYNRASMQRFFVERRIRDVHERLVRAREELAVLNEQYAVVSDHAEDARLRSMVSETPLATHEYGEVRRHADAMARAREALLSTVVELEQRRATSSSPVRRGPSCGVEERPADDRAHRCPRRCRRGRGHRPVGPEGDPPLGRLRRRRGDGPRRRRRCDWRLRRSQISPSWT